MTVQHVVLFNFPARSVRWAGGRAGGTAAMRKMVASWPSEIGLMSMCRLQGTILM